MSEVDSVGAPRLEPMSWGMVLDASVRMHFKNLFLFVGILGAASAPYYLIVAALFTAQFVMPVGDAAAIVQGVLAVGYLLGSLVFTFLLFPLSVGAVFYAVGERYLGREITIVEAYRAAWKQALHLILTWLLFTFIGAGVTMVVFLPIAVLIAVAAVVNIVAAVVVAALLAPFGLGMILYCYARMSMAMPSVMLESRDVIEALKRSWNLTQGHLLRIAGVYATIVILIWVVIGGLIGVGALLFGTDEMVLNALFQFCNLLVNLCLSPVLSVALILLYYDIRIREEGFDLDLLSELMHPGESPAAAASPLLSSPEETLS